jgi:hypothetical protein
MDYPCPWTPNPKVQTPIQVGTRRAGGIGRVHWTEQVMNLRQRNKRGEQSGADEVNSQADSTRSIMER